MYWPDDPAGDSSEGFGDWTFTSTPDGPIDVEWPLLSQAQGQVAAKRPVSRLPGPPKNMTIYAWTLDASALAGGPFQFTVLDLTELEPGQVSIANDVVSENDQENTVISRPAFDALDCATFG